MKDLSKHIIPAVATKWYELGLELLDSSHEKVLENIERDGSRFDVQWCCRKMLTKWLEVSDDATWGQVIDAVKSINMNDLASSLESLLPQSEQISCGQGWGCRALKFVSCMNGCLAYMGHILCKHHPVYTMCDRICANPTQSCRPKFMFL